jgi:hypothetical protein
MRTKSELFLILMLAGVIMATSLPCRAQGTSDKKKEEQKKEDIWTEEELPGPGGPPGRGPGRFELTEEEIERIMKSLAESNPEKAKELEKLRKEDERKFQEQLREHGREEFGKIIRERIEQWMGQRREEFLKWLDKNFHRDAEELKRLQDNPDLYLKKYELLWQKYRRIFEAERRNPELADVLKEKLRLGERQDWLLRKIRRTEDEKKKKELIDKLKEVVSGRFDLIVREKQIAYKWLRERLEELKRRVEESQAEIDKLMNPSTKKQNVDKQVNDLLEEKGGC